MLALVGAQRERIYVGKERNHHTMRQEHINALLVRLAREGKRWCASRAATPSSSAAAARSCRCWPPHGVPFEVVPGITAACGVASYAGIPLTHRDYAQSCLFVTGHLKDGSCDLDWAALARPRQTW